MKKNLLNFNTKILNRYIYNKHYFSIGKTVLKIHPEKFMTYVKNKKSKIY